MKKLFFRLVYIIVFILLCISCTKELTDDIFDFDESFFTLESSIDDDQVDLGDTVNFSLSIIESPIESEYTLRFSSVLEGVFLFEGDSFISGQSLSVEPGGYNITYIPEEEGIHDIVFTVTNSNETPISLSEPFSINVGNVPELNNDFELQIELSEEEITAGETVTITINLSLIHI